MTPTISVIIPALNEALMIGSVLEAVRTQDPDEILVVDGGSEDTTVEIAGAHARVILSPGGRGRQMNRGAACARGDIFLFLHADTRLPAGGLDSIRSVMSDREVSGGRFRIMFDDPHPLLRLMALYARLPVFSYGDQGFFVRREVFQKLAGYREDIPLEDSDFFARLRRAGRTVILPQYVLTSARRFVGTGILRQKFLNILIVIVAGLGLLTPSRFRRLYPDIRIGDKAR